MRTIHRLSFLVILALTCIFMEPAWVTGQGWSGYGYNWPYCYPQSQADYEQHMWDIQTYYFLNQYDPYVGPAYSQPRYSTPAYNIPTNRAVPTYTAAYSTPSSYNTPANNQSVVNGNATYWLNEANVFLTLPVPMKKPLNHMPKQSTLIHLYQRAGSTWVTPYTIWVNIKRH